MLSFLFNGFPKFNQVLSHLRKVTSIVINDVTNVLGERNEWKVSFIIKCQFVADIGYV